MKEDKALHIAVGMGVVGGFIGGAVLAFLIYVFGIIDVDPQIVKTSRAVTVASKEISWLDIIGAFSGWAAAVATGLVGLTTLRPIINQVKHQQNLAYVDALEREVEIIKTLKGEFEAENLNYRVREISSQLESIRGANDMREDPLSGYERNRVGSYIRAVRGDVEKIKMSVEFYLTHSTAFPEKLVKPKVDVSFDLIDECTAECNRLVAIWGENQQNEPDLSELENSCSALTAQITKWKQQCIVRYDTCLMKLPEVRAKTVNIYR